MFGSIGMPELVLIFIVALLVFGPKKLPEIGKSIGKGLAEFKRASDDLKRTIEQEIEQGKQEVASVREHVAGVIPAATGPPRSPRFPRGLPRSRPPRWSRRRRPTSLPTPVPSNPLEPVPSRQSPSARSGR